MKKILISLATVVFVGAMAYGATGAFFTSTQTSTGNTFTAGTIAFNVDSKSEYNNAVCVANPNLGVEDAPQGTDTTDPYVWSVTGTPQPDQYPVAGTKCTGTWTASNIGLTGPAFFDFTDVKPADQGEDTISLDNTGNPAWACMAIDLTENSATSSNSDIPFDGFLADDIQVFLWRDVGSTIPAVPGDNIYSSADGDIAITSAPESINSLYGTGSSTNPETVTIPLVDSKTGGGTPLGTGANNYVGFAWCAGTLTVDPSSPSGFDCNGSSMGNNAQGNSLMANITLMESQSRNQATYQCGSGETDSPIVTPDNT